MARSRWLTGAQVTKEHIVNVKELNEMNSHVARRGMVMSPYDSQDDLELVDLSSIAKPIVFVANTNEFLG